VRTPHIDAFAAEGLRFTSFYAASIDTRAARWSLLTGLNVGHAPPADQSNATERFCLNENRMSLANVLWQAGYATAFVGVWRDRELPLDHGADEWTGVLDHPEPGPYPEFLYVDTA